MIKSLHIRNYAIIEALEIHFSKGLTIITGETGAGKSILLGALGLIMGQRADIKSLHNLNEKCVVEGIFDVGAYDLKRFFEIHELDYETEVVVRREITTSGKSRAFINDTPVNLTVLQQLSSSLIDLHQQFDTLDIHEVSFQLRLVDALAGNKRLLGQYQALFTEYQNNVRRLQHLKNQDASAAREAEFLSFQLEELSKAELRAGEQEQLEEELNQLSNAEEIKATLAQVAHQLTESELSTTGQLTELLQAIGQVRSYHSDLRELYERFQGLLVELEDISGEFEKIAEASEHDPLRLQEVQERLDLIYRLQNKHHCSSVASLLELQAQWEQQLEVFNDLSGEIGRLGKAISQQQEELNALAGMLSERRRTVIPGFEKEVIDRLADLAMEHAQLKVDIQPTQTFANTGKDEIQYLFAANRGSRLQPIKDVASGGELSRLTLVTKSLVARSIPLPTLIFDEIETGISGDVALRMGKILRKLSDEHQVVSITHSPQIASKADAHYFVYKEVTDDRTFTKVKKLDQEGRIYAIATMLSQNPPSDSAMENARELLGA